MDKYEFCTKLMEELIPSTETRLASLRNPNNKWPTSDQMVPLVEKRLHAYYQILDRLVNGQEIDLMGTIGNLGALDAMED